jgi:predicted  nucleic acid-binding Zn-ribbon protein
MSTQSETAPAGESELRDLLALQDQDLHVDQLRHRRSHLPELVTIAEIDHRLAQLNANAAAVGAERNELYERLSALESEAEELTKRVATIESRLSGGAASSFRDQESMAVEIDSLTKRRHDFEDDELELMESLEPLEARLAELENERDGLVQRRGVLAQQAGTSQAALDGEIAALAAKRSGLAQAVPAALLDEYERLRSHLGGIGAARVERGQCSGCNLALSASELDHIRHSSATAVFHCEQCGRILIP